MPWKMRPLLIGPDERARIRVLRDKASNTPISREVMARGKELATENAEGDIKGELAFDARAYTIDIPMGFLVTYTVEFQPKGPCRHMSVSVATEPGFGPSPESVQMLMQEFGFINPLERVASWLEDIGDGHMAVNIVEPVDGNWEPHRRRP